MKVGDLVRDTDPRQWGGEQRHLGWAGVVIAPYGVSCVVVYWNDKYPAEVEDKDYLEVISESR